jgi:hypothetical protein
VIWNDEAIERLREMAKTMDRGEIAAAFGVSKNSIIGKCARLNISPQVKSAMAKRYETREDAKLAIVHSTVAKQVRRREVYAANIARGLTAKGTERLKRGPKFGVPAPRDSKPKLDGKDRVLIRPGRLTVSFLKIPYAQCDDHDKREFLAEQSAREQARDRNARNLEICRHYASGVFNRHEMLRRLAA